DFVGCEHIKEWKVLFRTLVHARHSYGTEEKHMKNESRDSRDVDTYEITAISGKRLKWVKKHGLEDERSDETVNLPQFEEEILRWIKLNCGIFTEFSSDTEFLPWRFCDLEFLQRRVSPTIMSFVFVFL